MCRGKLKSRFVKNENKNLLNYQEPDHFIY